MSSVEVGGNREFLIGLLKEFFENHADAPDDIARALMEGRMNTAQRIIHTLKGVAANLSAVAATSAAAALERIIASGREKGLDAALKSLREALDEGALAIEILEEPDPGKTGTDHEDLEETRCLWERLERMVAEDDIEAEHCLKALRGRLSGYGVEASLLDLGRCLNNLDFESAEEPMDRIREALQRGLAG